ncbi:MAG: RNA 3'-terminal phosphate cyclase, partial [Myxococcales bacterium]
EKLGWAREDFSIVHAESARGPGNALLLEFEAEHVTEVFSAIGEQRKSAERVALEAVEEAREWLAAGVPVGPHLADQLLLPLALAKGGAFRSVRPTGHTRTQIDVVRTFLGVDTSIEDAGRGDCVYRVG